MDFRATARALRDPENQPHQWNDQELAKFFVTAADEIERLQEALQIIVNCDPSDFEVTDIVEFARSALQQKDSE